MARNIEIKARMENLDSILIKAAHLADHGPVEIFQDDTFFLCQNGRLKLRVFSPNKGELIFYRRTDQKGPKESFYLISSTTEPESLRECLSQAYGRLGRIRKNRTLFLVGRTRIHCDLVEHLGAFLELEVVLEEGEDATTGESIAKDLMEKLGVLPDQLIEGAYIDLLAEKPPDEVLEPIA